MEEFAENGYAASSVEDICARGGFTRGAFYSSFTSKDELIAALFTREVERQLTLVEELLQGIEDADDPVALALERCMTVLGGGRTWTLVATEYTLLASRRPEAAVILQEHRRRTQERLVGLVDRVRGSAGLTLTMPTADLVTALIALHDGLALAQVGAGTSGTDVLRRGAVLALMRGATAPPADQEN